MSGLRMLLANIDQARTAMTHLWGQVRPLIREGKRFWISVQEETRTLPQNAKFHAACTDLAKSGLQWAGKKRSAAQWKVLLVSGHAVATKEGADMVPGLEGEFVNLRESTALMSVSRSSSLIEYTIAFCAMNRVELSDPEDYRNWGVQT